MTIRRVLGVTALFVLLATTVLLSQPEAPEATVLSAEAMREPVLDFSPTSRTTDTESNLSARLVITTTTEYQTTTTSTEPPATSTTTPETTTTTTKAKAKASSTTTTTPPPPTTTTTAAPGGYNSGHESSFTSKINSYRASGGLASLTRNSGLDSEARAWSKRMAEQGSLSHSSLGRLIPPWSGIGENLGAGPSVNAIFSALVASPTHVKNILGNYTHVGIGVWVDSTGLIWTTHLFAR